MRVSGVGAAVVMLALACAPGAAWAGPAPGGGFVVTGEAARQILSKSEISRDTARKIVQACLDFASARGATAAVVVVNPTGSLVVAERMDGQNSVSVDSAFLKAKSAAYMRSATSDWASRKREAPSYSNSEIILGQFWMPGGLPIVVDDQVIGAIGVGGTPMEEECARTAIESVVGAQPRR